MKGYYGTLQGDPPSTDYKAPYFPIPRNTFKDNKIQYTQTNNTCTLYGCIGAISDLTGYAFSDTELAEIEAYALSEGFDPKLGGQHIGKAVDQLRHYWNERHTDDPLASYRVSLPSFEQYRVLKQGYSIVTAYSTSFKYWQDVEDGRIDSVGFSEAFSAHCIRITKNDKVGYEQIVDNSKGYELNIYDISYYKHARNIFNRVFFNYGYIFCFEKDKSKI